MQERQRAWLSEIVARVNDLFDGELTEQDKLVYVNDVLKGNAGRDALYGEAANDTFAARDKDADLLDGGKGKDRGEWDKKDSRERVP